jgi:hypothetical protein
LGAAQTAEGIGCAVLQQLDFFSALYCYPSFCLQPATISLSWGRQSCQAILPAAAFSGGSWLRLAALWGRLKTCAPVDNRRTARFLLPAPLDHAMFGCGYAAPWGGPPGPRPTPSSAFSRLDVFPRADLENPI